MVTTYDSFVYLTLTECQPLRLIKSFDHVFFLLFSPPWLSLKQWNVVDFGNFPHHLWPRTRLIVRKNEGMGFLTNTVPCIFLSLEVNVKNSVNFLLFLLLFIIKKNVLKRDYGRLFTFPYQIYHQAHKETKIGPRFVQCLTTAPVSSASAGIFIMIIFQSIQVATVQLNKVIKIEYNFSVSLLNDIAHEYPILVKVISFRSYAVQSLTVVSMNIEKSIYNTIFSVRVQYNKNRFVIFVHNFSSIFRTKKRNLVWGEEEGCIQFAFQFNIDFRHLGTCI